MQIYAFCAVTVCAKWHSFESHCIEEKVILFPVKLNSAFSQQVLQQMTYICKKCEKSNGICFLDVTNTLFMS